MEKIWLGRENGLCVPHMFPDGDQSPLNSGGNFVPIYKHDNSKNIK
jgi:hypothetical protein